MTRDWTRRLPFVLLGLLTLAFVPALALPPGGPAPELACPTPCDDQNACTTDTCDTTTGTCRYETVSCDDGNPCTTETCYANPLASPCFRSGCCIQPLTNIACNDGNSCTQGDHCESGTCFSTALAEGTSCDDGNPCTDLDACNDSLNCVGLAQPAGSPCSDGTACTMGDACAPNGSGGMVCSGAPVDCSDSNPCTQDVCDSATGACSNPAVNCDDGNQCTTDSLACSGGLVCNHVPHTGSCQDADLCSREDFCSQGVCVRSGSCDDHVDCTADFCDSGLRCLNTPVNSLCADNLFCTFNERCTGSGCTSQVHFGHDCPTGDPCSLGFCAFDGHCAPEPKCRDGNSCTQDLCDASTGICSFPVASDGTACSDGSNCTSNDICQAGVCTGTSPNPGVGLPQLFIQSLTPNLLMHANHKLIEVHATVTAITTCGGALTPLLVSITSSQPDDAPGPSDGHTTGDIQGATIGAPDFDFLLRGEFDRDSATPRFYTITYSATANGFTVTGQASIQVYQKKAILPAGTASPKKAKGTRD